MSNFYRVMPLFVLLFLATSMPAQENNIGMPAVEIPLEDLLVQLETDYGLLFSYRQEDIAGILVTPPDDPQPLDAFLKATLLNSNLTYEIVNTKFVLLSKRQIDTPEPPTEKLLQLCGIVLDSLTGEPLAAANVYLKNSYKGTVTLVDGTFQLGVALAAKRDTVIISYVGYQEQRLSVQALADQSCPNILLNYYSFGDDFLVVTEYLTDGILHGDNGAYTQLQPDNMGILPGQVEPDVLNTIQFLPGVSSLDGSPAGICVQGGTPDQNLILWEDIPIYHTAHYFGTLTATNPFIVDKVSVYTGGFGAEYGGRISGVIALHSEIEEQEANTIAASTNLIYGALDGQLLSKDRKLSMIYSVRQSITGLWQSPSFRNISKRVQQGILVQNVDLNRLPDGIRISDELTFFDTNVKLNYRLSEKDEFSAVGFYAKNDFEDLILDDKKQQAQADTFLLNTNGLQLSWRRQWRPRLRTKLTTLHTNYGYDYGYSVLNQDQPAPNKIGQKQSSIQEQQIHLIADYQTNREHRLKLGYQLIRYDVAFDVSRGSVNDGSAKKDFLSNLHVLYADLRTNPNRKLGIQIGLRLNRYEQIEQQYLEPRLRLWYKFNDQLNTYLSAGKYYQYLSQIIQFAGDEASIETPVWGLTGSKEVPVLNANHFQWGMVYRPNTWLVDLQVYSKNVQGLTSVASGFDEGLSNRFHLGNANIQGLSLLIKKRWKHYKSWLSYAWSNIDHEFPTFFDQEFSATIEQKHRLRWAHLWTIGNFECSLGWAISSGRPFSDRANFMVVQAPPNSMGPREIVMPVQNEFNSGRLPAEHQLDASVQYTFLSSSPQQTKGSIGVSLYNIYHQRNTYSRELYIDNRPNMPAALAYNDKVNMGFTPSILLRLSW